MGARSGLKSVNTGAGFTLVELLLAVVLVLLLLGALVFNFSGLQRGAALDEGALQVEALLRFARAESANGGKPIQLIIPGVAESQGSNLTTGLRLVWEPDSTARPGVFESLPGAGEYLRGFNDLVRVERARLGPPKAMESRSADPARGSDPVPDPASKDAQDHEAAETAEVVINFYPDGSSDSAELVLASRSEEDLRRIVVQLFGVTGSIRRHRIETESNTDPDRQLDSPDNAIAKPPTVADTTATSSPRKLPSRTP